MENLLVGTLSAKRLTATFFSAREKRGSRTDRAKNRAPFFFPPFEKDNTVENEAEECENGSKNRVYRRSGSTNPNDIMKYETTYLQTINSASGGIHLRFFLDRARRREEENGFRIWKC